ncbi:hypothetical protein OIV83_004702 [Microbotryomycetes sp. JL201]|nr:hypothetical protein OIV83_004702 [Microbotryomycetes sp. JL201]
MLSVSLPTHVTGYFLSDTVATVLIWITTATGFSYAICAGVCFFLIMNQAISDAARYGESSSRLKIVQWALPLLTIAVVGASFALYFVALRHDEAEWESFCLTRSLIVVPEADGGGKKSSEDAKRIVCRQMFLNQTYIVPGAPLVLVMLEIIRFWPTRSFLTDEQDDDNRGGAPEQTRSTPSSPSEWLD